MGDRRQTIPGGGAAEYRQMALPTMAMRDIDDGIQKGDVAKWKRMPTTNKCRADALRIDLGAIGECRRSADDAHIDDIIRLLGF